MSSTDPEGAAPGGLGSGALLDDSESARDLLREFRRNTLMSLGWIALPFLLPFSIYTLYAGSYVMGAITLVIVVAAVSNSVAVLRGRSLPMPYVAFHACAVAGVIFAMSTLGLKTAFWSFPVFVAGFFVLERHVSRVVLSASFVLVAGYGFWLFPFEVSSRFAVTLGMTSFFAYMVVTLIDRFQHRLTELAIRDPLTGAFNRRHMVTSLRTALEEARRGFGPASLVVLDIDHFKAINDRFGHEAGDRVLKELVALLQRRQRRVDQVFRIGGEEFVVVLRNTSLEPAVQFAESLRAQIASTLLHRGERITVSAGVAQLLDEDDTDDWLRRGDECLYEAKRAGRNRVAPRPGDEATGNGAA